MPGMDYSAIVLLQTYAGRNRSLYL